MCYVPVMLALHRIFVVNFSQDHLLWVFYNRNRTRNENYSSNKKHSSAQHNNRKQGLGNIVYCLINISSAQFIFFQYKTKMQNL
jgi:hypothetical protein